MGGACTKHEHAVVASTGNSNAAPQKQAPTKVKTAADDENSPTTNEQHEKTYLHQLFPLSPAVVTNQLMSVDSKARGLAQEGAHHIRNVFATPLSIFAGGDELSTRHPKTPQEIQFMSQHLRQNYLFEDLPHDDMVALIGAFEKMEITASEVAQNRDKAVLIRQGDVVDKSTAYFYLLYRGTCRFTVNGTTVGVAKPGDSFGELALLYDCPRAATVVAVLDSGTPGTTSATGTGVTASMTSTTATFTAAPDSEGEEKVVLFRVHQRAFRRVLQQADQIAENAKMNLLENVAFLKNVSRQQKVKLAAAMRPRPFKEGEYLSRKGEQKCSWTLIDRGSVLATNISEGPLEGDSAQNNESGMFMHSYDDVTLGEGDCFGERSISTGLPTVADLIAESDGIAFVVDRESFLEILGDLKEIIHRSLDQLKLQAIHIIATTTQKDERMLNYLASQIVDVSFEKGKIICKEGEPLILDAGLYLVREGKVEVRKSSLTKPEIINVDGFFGDDQLNEDKVGRTKFVSDSTVVALTDCVCGVLKLESCRRILDTHRMGMAQNINELDSIRIGDLSISLDKLKLYKILGAGTFGQVYLVSRKASNGSIKPYALKVQSKYELCESGQARGVVREKNIMIQFHNPFVAGLVGSFADDDRVYMLMNLLQGGELHSVMHSSYSDVLSEKVARFYCACIAEGLSYMHRHLFVYRDLKPEVRSLCFYCDCCCFLSFAHCRWFPFTINVERND